MDMNSKNKWVEDALESLNNAERAVPSDAIYNRIAQQLDQPYTKAKIISLRTVSVAAACILLLVMANVYTLSVQKATVAADKTGARSVAAYYDINNTANEIMGL